MSPTALRITAPLLATLPALAWAGAAPLPRAAVRTQRPNTWVKLSPVPGGPPSPQLGYEGACAWDGRHGVLIRYGGHNQGGGGEQHSELWTFDPLSGRWTLKEPNTSPPGVCCAQQNVFDPVHGRYLRFPSFSGSHGWQWWREIYLNDSSVWSYDLTTNRWRNLRPLPAPSPRPLRCAAWDSGARAAVLFGGEGSREGTLTYDPAENTWSWPKPASQPAFRSGGNMAYDASRRLHILFGSQFDDDRQTWIYDSTRTLWSAVRPPTQPPTAQNDAVLAYDPLRREALAVVKVTQGMGEQGRTHLESWAFDAGKLAWRKLSPDREPDPSGNRARVLVFAPELNAALLENRPHPPYGPAEQQVWSYRFEDGPVALPLPAPERSRVTEDLSVSVLSPRHVRLCWEPAGGDPAGYLVERAAVEVYTDDQLRRLKAQTPPLVQPMVGAITRIGPFRTLTPRL
ncbi:MAG: hypothetical protein FJX77_04170, partial [Armatimonadetes bacterium]|nr:hypothetical protein [Armatimonadota bacterium]